MVNIADITEIIKNENIFKYNIQFKYNVKYINNEILS